MNYLIFLSGLYLGGFIIALIFNLFFAMLGGKNSDLLPAVIKSFIYPIYIIKFLMGK